MDTNFVPLGDARLRRVLDAVVAEGDGAEAHYLEAKSDIDLGTPLGLAKVAKFVLGAANRLPAQAAPHFEGYAVMVLGAAKGAASGVPKGTESHELHNKLRKYLGPDGPGFDLGRLPVSDDREVLFIVVDPPRDGQPPYPCHKDFHPNERQDAKHSLQDGGIYVRPNSETRTARAPEVLALHTRGRSGKRDPVDLQVEVVGQPARLSDQEALLERWVEVAAEKCRAEGARWRAETSKRPSFPVVPLLPGQVLPEPATEEEDEVSIDRWRRSTAEKWPDHIAVLAGAAFGGIGFQVTNVAASYLSKPRIDVTLHGCLGVQCRDPEATDLGEILPPVVPAVKQSWTRPDLSNIRFRDYPVDWHNVGDNLVVTLTPDALRPRTPWVSDRDDVVVLVRDPDSATVQVSWVATAEGRGEQFAGESSVSVASPASAFTLLRAMTSRK